MVGARVTALVKDAEKIWQTPGRCVTLKLTGSPNRVRPGGVSSISGAATPSRPGVTEAALLDLASFDADYIAPHGSAVTVAKQPLTPGVPWFDFTAPGTAWAKSEAPGLDVFFYSKGGIGRAPITYPAVGFPGRFTGTWTRIITDPLIRLGWKETVQGTATFVRNPVIPGAAEGVIAVPYDFQSGSVTWTVSGTGQDGTCTTTFSGSGNDAISPPSAIEFTSFMLEDVSAKTTTTTPFYYSIRATGERLMPPLFTITSTGPSGCANSSQEPIVVFFLDIGVVGDLTADTPVDQVEKSGDITLLEGHRTRSDPGMLATDDTWSFKGSD